MMKKLTLLLVVFLSTSVLFAQNKVAKPMAEAPPILTNKIEAPVGTLNLHNSETPTINSVQLKKNKELAATMEIPSDSPELQKANLEMNNRLKQNEAKSIAAKAERDNYSEAIKKRMERAEKVKAEKAQQKYKFNNMQLDENGNPVNNNQLKN